MDNNLEKELMNALISECSSLRYDIGYDCFTVREILEAVWNIGYDEGRDDGYEEGQIDGYKEGYLVGTYEN